MAVIESVRLALISGGGSPNKFVVIKPQKLLILKTND